MADFPIDYSWERQKQEKIDNITSFMELCRECGNTEALYRKGAVRINFMSTFMLYVLFFSFFLMIGESIFFSSSSKVL